MQLQYHIFSTMGENFGERLRYFIERHLFMNIKEFEKSCEFSTGTIHRAINNGTNIGVDKLSIIANFHPELNIDWLLTGEGAMIEGAHTLPENKNLDMNANIKYSSENELLNKLSDALLLISQSDKIKSEAMLRFTENDGIRAKNEETHLEIQKKLVVLLEKK